MANTAAATAQRIVMIGLAGHALSGHGNHPAFVDPAALHALVQVVLHQQARAIPAAGPL